MGTGFIGRRSGRPIGASCGVWMRYSFIMEEVEDAQAHSQEGGPSSINTVHARYKLVLKIWSGRSKLPFTPKSPRDMSAHDLARSIHTNRPEVCLYRALTVHVIMSCTRNHIPYLNTDPWDLQLCGSVSCTCSIARASYYKAFLPFFFIFFFWSNCNFIALDSVSNFNLELVYPAFSST